MPMHLLSAINTSLFNLNKDSLFIFATFISNYKTMKAKFYLIILTLFCFTTITISQQKIYTCINEKG